MSHIISKAYDVTAENINKLIKEIELLQQENAALQSGFEFEVDKRNLENAELIAALIDLQGKVEGLVDALEKISTMKYDNDLGWGGHAKQALAEFKNGGPK